MGDPILQAKQVAEVLGGGINEKVVKQWTFGRPYTIAPSIRGGKGAGQANLYSLDDVFLFAVAAEMHAGGIAPEKVRLALSGLHKARPKEPSLLFLHDGEVEFVYAGRTQTDSLSTDRAAKDWMSYYVLNLARLREQIERTAQKLSQPFKSFVQPGRENKK